jgi:hypothetical protein
VVTPPVFITDPAKAESASKQIDKLANNRHAELLNIVHSPQWTHYDIQYFTSRKEWSANKYQSIVVLYSNKIQYYRKFNTGHPQGVNHVPITWRGPKTKSAGHARAVMLKKREIVR